MANIVIDCHTHLHPEDVINHWEKYAKLCPTFRLLTLQNPGSLVKQCYATAEQTIALADEAGIDKIVMLAWYWTDFGLCQYQNDYMKSVIDKYPNRFVAYACINPVFGWRSVYEVERCKNMGFAGVGELGPGSNEFSLDNAYLLQVLEAAEHYHLPVNFHCSESVGHPYKGKDATAINGFYHLAKRFPNLRLILAHLGGGLPFYELYNDVKEVMQNVYYDFAGNPLLYDISTIAKVARLIGKERLLYGSDFPLILHPKKQQDASFKFFIDDIKANSQLPLDAFNDVMGNNMQRLIDYSQLL